MFRRWRMALFLALLVSAVSANAAIAQNPHFIRNASSATQTAANAVTVTFKLAGLGAGEAVDITASAPVTINEQCVNRGGNEPQAANKRSSRVTVSDTQRFIADDAGNVVGSITLVAPEGTLQCPPGQDKETTYTFGSVTLSAPQVRRSLTVPLS